MSLTPGRADLHFLRERPTRSQDQAARTRSGLESAPGRPLHHQRRTTVKKNDAQRIAAYIAKTVPTTVGLKVASMLSGMKAGFGTATSGLVAMEMAVQAFCNGEGDIPTIQYPFYMNFGRELWSLDFRGIDGPGLLFQAKARLVKYTSYGLDAAALKALALAVFSIVLP